MKEMKALAEQLLALAMGEKSFAVLESAHMVISAMRPFTESVERWNLHQEFNKRFQDATPEMDWKYGLHAEHQGGYSPVVRDSLFDGEHRYANEAHFYGVVGWGSPKTLQSRVFWNGWLSADTDNMGRYFSALITHEGVIYLYRESNSGRHSFVVEVLGMLPKDGGYNSLVLGHFISHSNTAVWDVARKAYAQEDADVNETTRQLFSYISVLNSKEEIRSVQKLYIPPMESDFESDPIVSPTEEETSDEELGDSTLNKLRNSKLVFDKE